MSDERQKQSQSLQHASAAQYSSAPQYSSRLVWNTTANPLEALKASLRSEGAGILDLTPTNPTACDLGDWSQPIAAALARPEASLYHPTSEGLLGAREAVCTFYADMGARVSPDDLLLTASTSESYSFLFQMLCDPGDEVLVPAPSYPLFEHLAGLTGVRLQEYRLHYQMEWLVDLRSAIDACSARTRAVIVVNPNNPTGSYLRDFELQGLLDLCAEKGLALIADEVFWEHTIASSAESSGEVKPVQPDRPWVANSSPDVLCFSLGGLSKSAGMPQMKVGWIVVRGPEQIRRTAVDRLRWIADTYLSVSAPVQYALSNLLLIGAEIREAILRRIRGNAVRLRRLAGSGWLAPLPVEGGWSAVVRLPTLQTDHQWCEALLRHQQVWVQPGYFYDFGREAHVVLSLLTPPDLFSTGLDRLEAEVLHSCT